MSDLVRDREFLFSSRFGGAEWHVSVFAADPDEAKARIRALALARYDGEVMAKIPAVPGGGLFVRLICWWLKLKPASWQIGSKGNSCKKCTSSESMSSERMQQEPNHIGDKQDNNEFHFPHPHAQS